jgi:hypothetical protein
MGFVSNIFGGGQQAPDTSGMNSAAVANAALSKEQLDWAKQIYNETAPDRKASAELSKQVAQQQLESSQTNDAISKDYWNYQKNTFRPLETGIVADAQNYDTPARRESQAAQAMGDVGSQINAAQANQNRAMQRTGVNPNSGKMMGMQNLMSLQGATAMAGAANKARNDVELQGYARKMDAANLGRNLASNQATSAGVALNAGNSAVQNAGVPQAQAQSAAAMVNNGFNGAVNANNSAASIYGNIAGVQNQANANSTAMWSALGNAGMQAAMFASDKNKKQSVRPANPEKALAAIEKTPVSTWQYKPGEGDGGTHTGPMAQNVQKNMGNTVAPGGKMIDAISMNGQTMAGMQALSKKVDKLEAQVKKVAGARQ